MGESRGDRETGGTTPKTSRDPGRPGQEFEIGQDHRDDRNKAEGGGDIDQQKVGHESVAEDFVQRTQGATSGCGDERAEGTEAGAAEADGTEAERIGSGTTEACERADGKAEADAGTDGKAEENGRRNGTTKNNGVGTKEKRRNGIEEANGRSEAKGSSVSASSRFSSRFPKLFT